MHRLKCLSPSAVLEKKGAESHRWVLIGMSFQKKKRNFVTKVYPTKVLGGLEKRKYVGNWMSRTGAFGKSIQEKGESLLHWFILLRCDVFFRAQE